MTITDILHNIGGLEMTITLITIGIAALVHGHKSKPPENKWRAYAAGVFVLFAGMSMLLGLFNSTDELYILDAVFKTISGTAGIITLAFIPRVIKELAAVQVINNTKKEIDVTNKRIDELSDIAEKMTIRNTNKPSTEHLTYKDRNRDGNSVITDRP